VDVAGAVAGLILLSIFTFWPAALCVAAIFIFGITNVARANVAELLPVASAFFYLLAYAVLTLLWLQCLKAYGPGRRTERMSIPWIMFALAGPMVLLVTVKLASMLLGRMFIVRDMLVSAMGIVTVVAGALIIAGRKSGTASQSDIP
jgi:hypothetical protein